MFAPQRLLTLIVVRPRIAPPLAISKTDGLHANSVPPAYDGHNRLLSRARSGCE
ncbi:MAG: hypothetical protein ACLP0A_08305 [Verrucomicrobiia bacterium]